MKIRPVGAELFHADGEETDRHDEANSRLWQFRSAPNKIKCGLHDPNRKQLLLQDNAELRVPPCGRDVRSLRQLVGVFVSQRRKSGLLTNPEMKSASSPINRLQTSTSFRRVKIRGGRGEEVWLIKSRSCNCSFKYLGFVGVEVEVFV